MPTKEAKTRHPSQIYYYHGVPIYYRVEHRNDGTCPTLCLSIRDEHGKIIYEASPRRFPKVCCDRIDRALELQVPAFLTKYFDPDFADGLARRTEFAQKGSLTFGVLYDLDMKYLCTQHRWRKDTFSKYHRQMKPLLDEFHTTPLDQLTPAVCIPLLKKLPYDIHCSCTSLLRQIFARECELGTYVENPWINYSPQTRRKKAKTTENLKQAELTTGQCQEILTLCLQQITATTSGSIYLAAAFLLLFGIPIKELCSLTYGDLKCTQEFRDCTVAQIQEERYQRDGNKQYIHMPILEGYRQRVLALPDILVDLCTMHLATFPKTMTDEDKVQCPLIHSPKNRRAAMRPDHLRKSLQKILGQFCESSSFGKVSVESRLIATAKSNLRRVGFSEEEMRYHFGWTPQSTAEKSYNDFACESQLNRRKRKLERWTQELCATLPDWEEFKSKCQKRKPSGVQVFSSVPGTVCLFRGTLQPFTVDDANMPMLDLEISSTGGLSSIKLEYIKISDGKDV